MFWVTVWLPPARVCFEIEDKVAQAANVSHISYYPAPAASYRPAVTSFSPPQPSVGRLVLIKFQEIERTLNLYQYHERYSQMEDPSAPLRVLWKQIGVKGPPKMRLGDGRRGGWGFGL